MQNGTAQRGDSLRQDFRPRTRVLLIDRAAESIITLGGLAVIAAVLGIIAYLLMVVFPLTQPGRAAPASNHALRASPGFALLDEYNRLAAIPSSDDGLSIVAMESGLAVPGPSGLITPALSAFAPDTGTLAYPKPDGSVVLGSLGFTSAVLRAAAIPEGLPALEIGTGTLLGADWFERTGEDQYRKTSLLSESIETLPAPESAAQVVAIDAETFARDKTVAVLREDGSGLVSVISTRRSLVGASRGSQIKSYTFTITGPAEPPIRIIFLSGGAELVALWADGSAQRHSRTGDAFTLTESLRVTDENERITAIEPLLGRGTILVGTDRGRVHSWMLTRSDESRDLTSELVRVQSFTLSSAPVTALAISLRDRTFAAADESGSIRLWHATSGKNVAAVECGFRPTALVIAPKLDAFIAIGESGVASWSLDPGHPTVTLRSLFLPVWYEGDAQPSFVYQSTSAEDSSEPKLSVTPLIFGTLKATVFALLFAVPIAVMAAIYASEFLPKSARSRVKPLVEMMASLPSVVLGFIAAMILAPFVRDHLPAVLVALVVVPLTLVVSASLWPLLPGTLAWRLPQSAQLGFVILACALGVVIAAWSGPRLDSALFELDPNERLVFAGETVPAESVPEWAQGKSSFSLADRNRLRSNGLYIDGTSVVRPAPDAQIPAPVSGQSPFKSWLAGTIGSPVPGWSALLFAPALACAGIFTLRFGRQSPTRWLPLARSIAAILLAIPLAYIAARLLSAAGFDARESLLGTFAQRNTFVVGVIMGFAIIPIIFTLSDDAMQSVPRSLRAASLGAGATHWQTAIRIVLPVAASGIFSAVMIGLGRAAGETMIVLMATGNTPVMDWNVFGGLRTLSANIAVELPEADRGGTHYRVLFLCGVVLFAITFVVNTTAEIIRQHFRKRSALL